jgi:hypothetical protein
MLIVMQIVSMFFLVAAFVSAAAGLVIANGAPQQAVFLAGACFLGIVARIAQASLHHREWLRSQEHKEQ